MVTKALATRSRVRLDDRSRRSSSLPYEPMERRTEPAPDILPTSLALAGFLAAVGATGATGSLFTPGAWYRTLRKPGWTPPNWLFPVAWTAL